MYLPQIVTGDDHMKVSNIRRTLVGNNISQM